MMSLLPPTGWADVATKTDLEHLAAVINERMDARFAAQDQKIGGLDHKIGALEYKIEASGHRTMARIAQAEAMLMKVIIGSVLATAIAVEGIAFAAAGLT